MQGCGVEIYENFAIAIQNDSSYQGKFLSVLGKCDVSHIIKYCTRLPCPFAVKAWKQVITYLHVREHTYMKCTQITTKFLLQHIARC